MPKNSMASGFGRSSFSIFCENECSEFVSASALIGLGLGSLAGFPVGFCLGVPVSIGVGATLALSGKKPEEILRTTDYILWFSAIIVGVGGAKVVSNMVAFPFWVTEKIVYDAPLKMVNLVRNNF